MSATADRIKVVPTFARVDVAARHRPVPVSTNAETPSCSLFCAAALVMAQRAWLLSAGRSPYRDRRASRPVIIRHLGRRFITVAEPVRQYSSGSAAHAVNFWLMTPYLTRDVNMFVPPRSRFRTKPVPAVTVSVHVRDAENRRRIRRGNSPRKGEVRGPDPAQQFITGEACRAQETPQSSTTAIGSSPVAGARSPVPNWRWRSARSDRSQWSKKGGQERRKPSQCSSMVASSISTSAHSGSVRPSSPHRRQCRVSNGARVSGAASLLDANNAARCRIACRA